MIVYLWSSFIQTVVKRRHFFILVVALEQNWGVANTEKPQAWTVLLWAAKQPHSSAGRKKTVQLAVFDKHASKRCRTEKPAGTRRSPRVETATQPAQQVCFSEMQTRSNQRKKGFPEKKLVLDKKKKDNKKSSQEANAQNMQCTTLRSLCCYYLSTTDRLFCIDF